MLQIAEACRIVTTRKCCRKKSLSYIMLTVIYKLSHSSWGNVRLGRRRNWNHQSLQWVTTCIKDKTISIFLSIGAGNDSPLFVRLSFMIILQNLAAPTKMLKQCYTVHLYSHRSVIILEEGILTISLQNGCKISLDQLSSCNKRWRKALKVWSSKNCPSTC